jgi:polar amino acid transport system permease protein
VDQFLETFFSWEHFKASFPGVLEGFRTNLSLMFVAEACVLVWGMVLALLRLGRGRAFTPLAGSRSATSTCSGPSPGSC